MTLENIYSEMMKLMKSKLIFSLFLMNLKRTSVFLICSLYNSNKKRTRNEENSGSISSIVKIGKINA